MTNREWLNSLTDEDFIKWLIDSETFDEKTYKCFEPSPKYDTLKWSWTSTALGLAEWLKEERKTKAI